MVNFTFTLLYTSLNFGCRYMLSSECCYSERVHGLWRVISQRWTFSWHVPSRCYQTVSWITSFLRQSPPVQCSPLRTPGQLLTPVALTTLQPCRYPSRPMWENFCGYFWPFFSFLPFFLLISIGLPSDSVAEFCFIFSFYIKTFCFMYLRCFVTGDWTTGKASDV